MSDAYQTLMTEHRRLAILRALIEPKINGTCNDSIMYSIVNDETGVPSTRDQIRTAYLWLEGQDQLNVKQMGSGGMIATITQNGVDTAKGLQTVIGIHRPSLGAR